MHLDENWIVRRKHNIKVGDLVSPLKAPRKHGVLQFTPVVGVVVEVTKNHIALEVGGSEALYYVYADCLFAVDPSWAEDAK